MRGIVPATHILWLLLPLLAAGCGKNPLTGNSTAAARVAAPGTSIAGQVAPGSSFVHGQAGPTLQGRAAALEMDNQQSKKLLAQSQQMTQLLRQQSAVLRDELKTANDRLAQLIDDKTAGDQKIQSLEASAKTGAGSFLPNNGLKKELEPIRIQGVDARIDGDVVRVELTHEKLLTADGQAISRQGHSLIDSVIAELQRTYPDHFIGVEGHTATEPGDPLNGDAAALRRSISQATAVFEYLTSVMKISPKQLQVVGHGPNHPVFSNATAAGRRRNNRVELVIYPERYR